MNMLIRSAEVECRGLLTKAGVWQPPIRALMDDLTVTTTSVPGCRWILQDLERLINWARMDFKLTKFRALVVRKGKVLDKFCFSWLVEVHKSGLPGKFKARIYQQGILPRLLWPLLIYDVPLSIVESFRRKISHFL